MKIEGAGTCEVKVGGEWRLASFIEAQGTYGFAPKRCPACHGAVYVLGSYGVRQQLRLTHRRMHPGCPLTPKTFSGTSSPHPDGLSWCVTRRSTDEAACGGRSEMRNVSTPSHAG
jgi:hypothetical protein